MVEPEVAFNLLIPPVAGVSIVTTVLPVVARVAVLISLITNEVSPTPVLFVNLLTAFIPVSNTRDVFVDSFNTATPRSRTKSAFAPLKVPLE